MSIFKKTALVIGDIIILYLSLVLTLIIRYGADRFNESLPNHLFPFSLIFLLWLIMFYLADLYRQRVLRNAAVLFRALFTAALISGIISTIIFYLFGGFFELTPKTNLFIFGIIFFVLDFLFRNSVRKIFQAGALNTTVIGDSNLIRETINYLKGNPHTGYNIVNLGDNPQLVVVQPHLMEDSKTSRLIYQFLHQEVNVINFWDFYEMIFEKIPLDELRESWFIENITTRRPFYDAAKRLLDFALAIILAIPLLPIGILIALAVKITSKGPIIYKPQRVGKSGLLINIYKFRTMKVIDEGPLWTEKNDSRITGVGRFLRFTHLDEIPQLWNIIRGDISFTGPRPEHVKLAEQYRDFPYYDIRHVVKPGLTGWAQINYRPSASLEEAREKLCYDIYYVKNRSIFLDLMIVLKTLRYIFTTHGQ